jgi:hypothetical protein
MAFNFSPKIVTDGLVLALDAANPSSYVSGSSVWRDLTPNNYSGSLINGPTFNSSNAGSIQFDGVDDYVQTIDVSSYSNLTFNIWLYGLLGSNIQQDILKYRSDNGGSFTLFGDNLAIQLGKFRTDGDGLPGRRFTTAVIPTQQWYNLCYVKNGSLYINSIKYEGTGADRDYNQIQLGANRAGNGMIARWNGYIAIFKIYNRNLSDLEVLQNYNALKGRFNLT